MNAPSRLGLEHFAFREDLLLLNLDDTVTEIGSDLFESLLLGLSVGRARVFASAKSRFGPHKCF
jgi:hypothetical protein